MNKTQMETNLDPSRGNTMMNASCRSRSIYQCTGDMNSSGCKSVGNIANHPPNRSQLLSCGPSHMKVEHFLPGPTDNAFNTWVRRRWSRIVVEDEVLQQQKRPQVELSQMEMHQSLPKDFADWLSPTAGTLPAWPDVNHKRHNAPPAKAVTTYPWTTYC